MSGFVGELIETMKQRKYFKCLLPILAMMLKM
jgi:hypothetical protein